MEKLKIGDIYKYRKQNITGDVVQYTILGIEKNEIYYRIFISNSYDSPWEDIGNMSLKEFKKVLYAGYYVGNFKEDQAENGKESLSKLSPTTNS